MTEACCTRDEGFVALRRRPAGGGVKPPHAALAEDCRGERCGKGGVRAVRRGPGKANASEPPLKRRESGTASEPGPQCRSWDEPGGMPVLLARRCPACRWREPGLRLACGNTGKARADTASRDGAGARGSALKRAEPARRCVPSRHAPADRPVVARMFLSWGRSEGAGSSGPVCASNRGGSPGRRRVSMSGLEGKPSLPYRS